MGAKARERYYQAKAAEAELEQLRSQPPPLLPLTAERMEPTPKEIRFYVTQDGNCPFAKWLDSLRDKKAGAKIRIRLDRLEDGNFGDFKSVGNGVFELRIDYGQGYRVYFGMLGSTLVILLSGGDKSTQERDILKSKEYWQDYRSREVE